MTVNELIEMLSKLSKEEREMTITYDDEEMGLVEIFNTKRDTNENGSEVIVLKNM